MPDDRGRGRPFSPQRSRPGGGAPFTPRPGGGEPFPHRPSGPPASARPTSEQLHSVRVRDGEREVEVSGSAAFVRQLLDDLPALLARLRADSSGSRPASISMPPPPAPPASQPATAPAAEPRAERPERSTNGHAGADPLTREVLSIMRTAARPMGIAEIRKRLSDQVTGQQVRRVLERASEQVVNTGGRPAEYRLR